VVLLDSSWMSLTDHSSSGLSWELFSHWLYASCQHPSRLSVSHELVSSWNIPFKYMRSSTFMELPSHPDMHLIACSKKLFVVCLVFFLMDSSYLVASDYEKKCIGLINYVQFITHIHAVKCAFETITSVRSHTIFYRVTQDEDMKMSFKCNIIPQSVLVVSIFSTFIYIRSCVHIGW
jgi:hypothetical protein